MCFVRDVELLTSNREVEAQKGHDAAYVTERAVLRRGQEGRMLPQIAAEVNVQKNVLTLIELPIRVSSDLRPMASGLFAGA